jgi:hypothetical protein
MLFTDAEARRYTTYLLAEAVKERERADIPIPYEVTEMGVMSVTRLRFNDANRPGKLYGAVIAFASDDESIVERLLSWLSTKDEP